MQAISTGALIYHQTQRKTSTRPMPAPRCKAIRQVAPIEVSRVTVESAGHAPLRQISPTVCVELDEPLQGEDRK